MNRGARRSMGTLKNAAKPQRSSSGTFNAPQQPSSALRKSKLPTASSGSAKRSSSNEGTRQRTSAALGHQFRTPRSKSAALRTPSSHRNPLSVIGTNSVGMKSPHSGKRSSVYGTLAQQKDSRPLTDKEWQRQTAKNLVDFCLTQSYPNQALTLKDILQLVSFNHYYTVWKLHEFSITQILHEINFGGSRSAKYAILTHLGALNFNVL